MQKLLKDVFGFDSFRPIQKEAINRILRKEDVLVVLPTGGGKSLIYQLPSLMMDGTTIVISPLIALMQDQVASLRLNGINARMLSSSHTNEQNSLILNSLLNEELKFLYVAPERFNDLFISSTASSTYLERSVSSILRINSPPCFFASKYEKSAVLAPPICKYPVGDGANLTLYILFSPAI